MQVTFNICLCLLNDLVAVQRDERVAPAMVDGPRFRKVCEEMSKRLGIPIEQAMRKHAEEYALKRVSTDEDVANAVVFLASDRAAQVTGVVLPIDGGTTAGPPLAQTKLIMGTAAGETP